MTKYDIAVIVVAQGCGALACWLLAGVFGVIAFVAIVLSANVIWYLAWPQEGDE